MKITHTLKYRSPRGYAPWDDLISRLSFIEATTRPNALTGLPGIPKVDAEVGSIAAFALLKKTPAVYVTRELLDALMATDMPSVPDDMPVVLPAVSFMLPEGVVPTELPGEYIRAITVTHFPKEYVTNLPPNAGNVVLRSAALSTDDTFYQGGVTSIAGSNGFISISSGTKDRSPALASLMNACIRLEALAVNLMLILTYKAGMLTTDSSCSGQAKGFKKADDSTNTFLPISWLGKSFRSRRSTPRGGTHATPQAHWRKGHWHTIRFGKGLQQSRIDWYQPIFVGAK